METVSVGTMQDRINALTTELSVKIKVLEETRVLLKRAEDDKAKLKVTLEEVMNNKSDNKIRKFGRDIMEVISNMKFQSPIVKRES